MTPAKAPPDFNPITAAFALRGNVLSVGPCGHGHINETYELVCDDHGVRTRYVLQRIEENKQAGDGRRDCERPADDDGGGFREETAPVVGWCGWRTVGTIVGGHEEKNSHC